jgi:hypothetical protein
MKWEILLKWQIPERAIPRPLDHELRETREDVTVIQACTSCQDESTELRAEVAGGCPES